MTLLHKERNLAGDDELVKALQKVGKTRFGTHWTAACALDPCLPYIWNLVTSGSVKFKVIASSPSHRHSLMSQHPPEQKGSRHVQESTFSFVSHLFEWPIAVHHHSSSNYLVIVVMRGCARKCVQCLVFWHASAATLKEIFSKNIMTTGIPASLASNVTEISNKRYKDFFHNSLYFTAFALDPREVSFTTPHRLYQNATVHSAQAIPLKDI